MCSKDDYVNWDDVDLDSLLVDYTDNDFYASSDFDSSSDFDKAVVRSPVRSSVPSADAGDVPKSKKLKNDKTAASACKFTYCCPVCQRLYKSPSGLRGHVLKLHKDISGSFKGEYCSSCHLRRKKT
jgi:hypothetical protein